MEISYLSKDELSKSLSYDDLIQDLEEAFSRDQIITPQRHHHDHGDERTLLLMPSWETVGDLGVKLVTINPGNRSKQIPSIQGIYVLYDENGTPTAIMDAKMLTLKRTAATSALASKYLSIDEASTLLMVGTGALAPELIKAHMEIRPINQVIVWGRDFSNAKKIAAQLPQIDVEPVRDLDSNIPRADVISVATMSPDPLVKGKFLRPGQHVDLVGSYKPDMREADDEVIHRSALFMDSEMAVQESGDLNIPIKKGLIQQTDIVNDIFELCRNGRSGRNSDEEITCFKSVGHALEDLVAAKLAIRKFNQ